MLGALASLALAACGGGGGGDSTATNTAPPPSSSAAPPAANPPDDTTPPPAPANTAPQVLNDPDFNAKVGATWSFKPDVVDDEKDPLTFTITGKPDWTTFDPATGSLSGIPAAGNVGPTQDIEITVSDGKDSASIGPFQIIVQAADAPSTPATNRAPTITGAPAPMVIALQSYIFLPTGADADGDKLTYSISGKPSWLTLNTSTGQLSGTPSRTQTGTFGNIRLSVSDGKTITSLAPFSINVTAAPITITGKPTTGVAPGTAYSFKPAVQDPSTATFKWSIVNQPIWASFNTSTGALTGTATTAGTTSNIRISVTDGKVTGTLAAFSITVENGVPTISGNPPTSAQAGKAYSFTPTAGDANKDSLSFTIANQPPWAAFSTTTGQLAGTPTSSQAGKTYAGIVITVTDGKSTASLPTFAILVAAASSGAGTINRAPTVSGSPLTTVNVGTPYSFHPTASDADGDSLTFAISNKPGWATFSTSDGTLSGTPAAGDVGTTSGIAISVTDGKGGTTSLAAFGITVTAVATGSATLSWVPPNENTDGSDLMNLAGYRIYYGTSSSDLNQVQQISNPGVTSGVVENLTPAKWYFSVRAYSATGTESPASNIASKTIE
jgi:putative Ig domain-containing protein